MSQLTLTETFSIPRRIRSKIAAALGQARGSIRLYLIAAVTLVLSPALLLVGWLASSSADAEQMRVEQLLRRNLGEISATLDREISTAQGMMIALASSHSLRTGDMEAFYRHASEVSRRVELQIVLRDPQTDRQIVNTARNFGDVPQRPALPEVHELERRALTSGRAEISEVFFAPAVNEHVVAVGAAITLERNRTYFLAVSLPADRLASIIASQPLFPGQLTTLINHRNTIIARSQKHPEFVGKQLHIDLIGRPGFGGRPSHSKNLEGIPYFWVNQRSDHTDWILSTGIPESALTRASMLSVASYTAAAGLLVLAGFAVAYRIGGHVSIEMGSLRHAAANEREKANEQFRQLIEAAPNGIVVIDSSGLIKLVNQTTERQFGYARDELIGRQVEILVPENLRARHPAYRTDIFRMPAARAMGHNRDIYARRKDGTQFPVEIGLSSFNSDSGMLFMATIIDISSRKKSEQELSEAISERDRFRRRLMQAHEDERLRLARELHDETGQRLASVMLGLKSISNNVTDASRPHLSALRADLESLGKSLHRVATELRPAALSDLGITAALQHYVSGWSQKHSIATDFHCREDRLDLLSDEICTTIYRAAQEALTNISKHAASTTSVSIVIDRHEAFLSLTIEDNEPGFEAEMLSPRQEDRSGGLGIPGMRERLSLIGGSLEIESTPGLGTTVYARIPLPREITAVSP